MALFTHDTAWLRRHRVLLPGVSTLVRLVSQVRDQAAKRMYHSLAGSTRWCRRFSLHRSTGR